MRLQARAGLSSLGEARNEKGQRFLATLATLARFQRDPLWDRNPNHPT